MLLNPTKYHFARRYGGNRKYVPFTSLRTLKSQLVGWPVVNLVAFLHWIPERPGSVRVVECVLLQPAEPFFFWQFQLFPALSHHKNSTNVPTVQLQVSYRIVRQVAQTNIFSIKCLCSAYFLKCACQTPAEHVRQVDRIVLWLECKIYIGRYQLNDPNSTNYLISFDWFNC